MKWRKCQKFERRSTTTTITNNTDTFKRIYGDGVGSVNCDLFPFASIFICSQLLTELPFVWYDLIWAFLLHHHHLLFAIFFLLLLFFFFNPWEKMRCVSSMSKFQNHTYLICMYLTPLSFNHKHEYISTTHSNISLNNFRFQPDKLFIVTPTITLLRFYSHRNICFFHFFYALPLFFFFRVYVYVAHTFWS